MMEMQQLEKTWYFDYLKYWHVNFSVIGMILILKVSVYLSDDKQILTEEVAVRTAILHKTSWVLKISLQKSKFSCGDSKISWSWSASIETWLGSDYNRSLLGKILGPYWFSVRFGILREST